MAQTAKISGGFYAHSFDRDGEYYCVLDGRGHVVSKYDDMTYTQAHRLAAEMNDEADEAELQEAAE